MDDGALGFLVVGIIVVAFIIASIYYSIEDNIKIKSIRNDSMLFDLDSKTTELLKELSQWINNCKRCSNNEFHIGEGNTQQLKIVCSSCNSYSTLKRNNTFYSVDVIEELVNHFIEITDLISKESLDANVASYKASGICEKYFALYDSLENEYFYFKKFKKHVTYARSISMLKVYSDGSKLDEAKKRLQTKKIGKLETKRVPLPEKVVEEWNYKRVTSGKKGDIIKKWAKNSGLKCIDGSKCGSVEFSTLENSKITFGHIIPQSWGKEYPHLLSSIHHPDNLYLTCQSCNSSLNSGFPDDELKKRISGKEGTIGDWLRNHLDDLNSTESS